MHLNVGQSGLNLATLPGRIAAVIGARYASITEAANRAGMSRTSVSQWVGGHKTPDTQNLGRFADVSEVSLSWLIDGTGPTPDLTPKKRKGKHGNHEVTVQLPQELPRLSFGAANAFAAFCLSQGLAFHSIRENQADTLRWIESDGGPGEWTVVPIEIRLTTG